jgi:hypothetical protein
MYSVRLALCVKVLNTQQDRSIVAVLSVPLVDWLQALHVHVCIDTAKLQAHAGEQSKHKASTRRQS